MKNFFLKVNEIFKKRSKTSESFSLDEKDDYKYRRLSRNFSTGFNQNEIPESLRERMYRVVFDLYLKNPFAKRILEITRDFAVGDGLQYECDDKDVKNVIDKFWNNSINNFDTEISKLVFDLGLLGEIVLKMNVNSLNGSVVVSYLNPTDIKDVIVGKENIKDIDSLVFFSDNRCGEKRYKVIKENDAGLLEGDIFYFRVNNLTNQIRGTSDLLPLVDWLDALDQFLFNSIERSALLNSFIYHIQWTGLNKDEVQEQMRKFGQIKPGSIFHTNENVKINAITPDLKASDTSDLARVIKNFILGSAGFPEHWFGEGGYTNLATAKEMGLPTFQKLKERQTLVLKIIQNLIRFQIDQAFISGRLNFDLNKRPKVTIRCIDVKESGMSEFTNSLVHLVNFVKSAIDSDLLDKETGKKIIQSTLELSGFRKI
jgi:hypothetical protein